MQDTTASILLNLLMLGLVLAGIAIFWALPVALGIRWARQKGYSPLWMLFGIHPIGGWIAAAVMQILPARARCLHCDQFFNQQFLRCPFCDTPNPARDPSTLAGGPSPFAAHSAKPATQRPRAIEYAEPQSPANGARSTGSSNSGVVTLVIAVLASLMLLGCAGVAAVALMRSSRQPVPMAALQPAKAPFVIDMGDSPGSSMSPQILREFPAGGKEVSADEPLEVGQELHGEWGGTWYLVEVRGVLPGGAVKVYWTDWRHDEVLPRTRLQHPPVADSTPVANSKEVR